MISSPFSHVGHILDTSYHGRQTQSSPDTTVDESSHNFTSHLSLFSSVHNLLTAKIITISVVRHFHHLDILLVFRHHFSVGAGGAGSIELHIKSSKAGEFLHFGKGGKQEIGGTYQKKGGGAQFSLFHFGGGPAVCGGLERRNSRDQPRRGG